MTKIWTSGLKKGGGDQAFLDLCKQVSATLSKALSSDAKLVLLSGDPDNLGAATLIYYLIEYHKMPYSKAEGHLKERRISVKLIDLY